MTRGSWDIFDLSRAGTSLLDDSAKSEPRIDDLFEQGKISSELQSVLFNFLTRKGSMKEGLLIALNGRHGQGKSAVLQNATEALDWKLLRGSTKLFPVRVSRFNCSDYSSEDLRNNFDYFLESARGWPLFFPLIFLCILLSIAAIPITLILWALGGDTNLSTGAQQAIAVASGALLTFLLMGLRPSRILMRDIWRNIRVGRSLWEVCLLVCDRIFVSSDILIIDDLDRAEPDQQKALLQSLMRHRGDFKSAVIVAFDDAPLLKALDGKRATSDFLTKVFDVSFRLSPMNARDAALMADCFANSICQINPHCSIARVFLEPMIIGDLARVFMLHGNASARFAKKLVNNVYVAARVGGFGRASDISALIRLHGVFQYIPALETELDNVAGSLLGASDSDILSFVRARFGEELPEVYGKKLERFLHFTSHMQPSNIGWLRLLRIWRTKPLGPTGDLVASNRWQRHWSFSWALNDAFIATKVDAHERQRIYQSIRVPGNEFVRYNDIELRSSGVGAFKNYASKPDQEDERYWKALVDRISIHDDEVNQSLTDEQKLLDLKAHQSMPIGQLVLYRQDGLRISSARGLVRHNLLSPEADIKHRLQFDLEEYYSSPQGGLSFLAKLERQLDNADVGAINTSWPSLLKLGKDGEIDQHFRDLRDILLDFPFDSKYSQILILIGLDT